MAMKTFVLNFAVGMVVDSEEVTVELYFPTK